MRLKSYLPFIFAASIALGACRPDPIPAKEYKVPALIQPYVDLFEQEAAKRGEEITIDNLRVDFEEDLVEGTAAGTCTFPTNDDPTPHIRLDTTSFNWRNNEYHREILVFHELGHCILNRFHRPDDRVINNPEPSKLPNNNFISIMRGTGEQVYGGMLNNFKRDYYLDELFDESTPTPDWAKNPPAYSSVGQKQDIFIDEFSDNSKNWGLGSNDKVRGEITGGVFIFESKDAGTAFFTSKTVNIDTDKDFEIEASIKIIKGKQSALMQWGGSSGNDLFFYGFNQDSTAFTGNWTVGLVSGQSSDEVKVDDFNKLTIRKIGEFYHIYINETYFDILEFETFFGNTFAFYVGPETEMHIDYLRISELL